MKAHGTAIGGYDMPSDHPAWETARNWIKTLFTRKNATEFPNDLRLYLF
jgi:hypothetical protein